MNPDRVMAHAVKLGLHPKQAIAYRSKARFKVIVAGRRTGKTHYAMVRLIAGALGQPGRYWYIAPTRIMAKDIMWAKLKATIHPSWLAGDPLETELRLVFKGGGEIQLHGAEDPDKLRGRPLRGVVFDEFADVKPEAWTEAIRPALSDHRGWCDFIGTPKAHNQLYEVYQRGQSTDPKDVDWESWQFLTIDNPMLPGLAQEVEDARRDMDERTFRQEYEASFEALAGRIYYAFDRALDVRPVTLVPGIPVSLSFDFNVNPATCIIGQAIGDEVRRWREVFVTHAGGEATRACAMAAKQTIDASGWRGPLRIYGDATGRSAKTTGPSDHAVLRELFPGATWCIGGENPHVRDRYAAVNSRFKTSDGRRHSVIDPSCRHLIADYEQVIFAENGEADKQSNPMLTHISDADGYWVAREWPTARKTTGGAASLPYLML